MLLKQHDGAAVASGDGFTWRAIVSSPEPDCVGDRVLGYSYPKVVPLLVGHDSRLLPVGTAELYQEAGRLMGLLRLPPAGTSAAADEARKVLEAGTPVGVSIGFSGAGKLNEFGGADFAKVEIHEVSLVGVGCCTSCRVTGKKCGRGPDTPVFYMLPATITPTAPRPKLYTVTPEVLASGMRATVGKMVAERVAFGRGRLDYTFDGKTYPVGQ